MSRGPGRVQAGVLALLAGGSLTPHELALNLGVREDSTRRALRGLERAGRVACLGYGPQGKRWGLPEAGAYREALWPRAREASVGAILGPRAARSLRRAIVSAL